MTVNCQFQAASIPLAIGIKDVEYGIQKAFNDCKSKLSDVYQEIGIFCCRFEGDDTGSDKDCQLFVNTMSKLVSDCKVAQIHSFYKGQLKTHWYEQCLEAMGALNQAKRSLFIFYYSGHGKCINGANSLVLTAKDCLNEHNRDSYRDFYYVKEVLMEASTINQMMDVLMVLDCCCSALGGNKIASLSGKVEFVSATPKQNGGVTSSRSRFTRAWCNAIDTFIKAGREFSVQDVIDRVNLNEDGLLYQNFKLFNLKYGNWYPIKLRKPAVENPLSRLPEVVKSRVVVVAFHIKEATGDDVVAELNKALSALNIGISAVATAAFGFNLLLVEMPEMIVDSLKLGQSYVSLIYSGKMLIIKNSQIYKGYDVMARITIQSQLYPTKAAMEQRLIEWIDNELPWLSRDEKSVISQRLSARLGWKWLEKSFEVTLDQVDNTFTLAYLD